MSRAARAVCAWWDAWSPVVLVGVVAAVVPLLGLIFVPGSAAVHRLLSDSPLTLLQGQWIAAHGIPHHLPFSGPGHRYPWLDQSWLAQLVDYKVLAASGYAGLAAFRIGILVLTFTAVAALIRRRTACSWIVIGGGTAALAGGLASLMSGGQQLALPLFAAIMLISSRDSARARPDAWLLAYIPLCAMWANVFGLFLGVAYVIGYLLLRAYRLIRAQEWVWSMSCLVLAVIIRISPMFTPYGMHMVHYHWAASGGRLTGPPTLGMHPPVFGSAAFFALVIPLALVLAVAVAAVIRRDAFGRTGLVFVLMIGIGGGMSVRYVAYFDVIAVLFVADIVRGWVQVPGPVPVARPHNVIPFTPAVSYPQLPAGEPVPVLSGASA